MESMKTIRLECSSPKETSSRATEIMKIEIETVIEEVVNVEEEVIGVTEEEGIGDKEEIEGREEIEVIEGTEGKMANVVREEAEAVEAEVETAITTEDAKKGAIVLEEIEAGKAKNERKLLMSTKKQERLPPTSKTARR